MSDDESDLEKAEGDMRAMGCCCSILCFPVVIAGLVWVVSFLWKRQQQMERAEQRGFEVILPDSATAREGPVIAGPAPQGVPLNNAGSEVGPLPRIVPAGCLYSLGHFVFSCVVLLLMVLFMPNGTPLSNRIPIFVIAAPLSVVLVWLSRGGGQDLPVVMGMGGWPLGSLLIGFGIAYLRYRRKWK